VPKEWAIAKVAMAFKKNDLGCSGTDRRRTEGAMFTARRRIDFARAQEGGAVSLRPLDWRKAFDGANVDSVLSAVQREGSTGKRSRLLRHMMGSRQLDVEYLGFTSNGRPQRSGILQGCSLSPLTFIAVMSCVMEDAFAVLSPSARAACVSGELADIACADDAQLARAISMARQACGLELHVNGFQLLQTRRQAEAQIGGHCVQCKESL
ncbi:unnamed protein product, partial [Prorocentrum cordatum]